MLTAKTIYTVLAIGGIIAGFTATRPLPLRSLRFFQMGLLPVLFCTLFLAGAGLAAGTLNKLAGVLLLAAGGLGLCLTLAPNLAWFFTPPVPARTASERKPPLQEDVHLQPIRQLIAGEKFQDACVRLENLLKTHRGQFPELLLMAKLYHQVNRNDRAAKCLLQMIHSAQEDSEQLTAMQLYHQLTNPAA